MADRSWMAVTVYECPEALREAVHAVLADYVPLDDHELFELGEQYPTDEIYLGADTDLVRAIYAAVAPDDQPIAELGIWLDVQQDPKYEFDGQRTVWKPGLGEWSAPSNAEGQPIISWPKIEQALRSKNPREAIERLYGKPWGVVQ